VAQADDVTRLVTDVLGGRVLGAYLHGSAVLGGLRPHSDLDVLALLSGPTTPQERRALVEGLLEISGRRAYRGPARPVELSVVVQAEVRPWRYPPTCELLYGEWLRDDYESGFTPAPGPSPDLAVLLTGALAGDTPLAGPPLSGLVGPVPHPDVVRACLDGVPGLLGDLDSDTTNVLLTFARIWTTLATGEIRSKDAAADWALSRLPEEHRAVLALARAVYLGDAEDDWSTVRPQVGPHVEHVLGEISRLS
jgi:streptomycin 3"-adenylyltransferase